MRKIKIFGLYSLFVIPQQRIKKKKSTNQGNGDLGLMLKRKDRMEKLWTRSCEDQTHRLQGGWGIKRVTRREC